MSIEDKIFFDEKIKVIEKKILTAKHQDLAALIADRNYRRASRAINANFKEIKVDPKGRTQTGLNITSKNEKGQYTYSKRFSKYSQSSKNGGLSSTQKLKGVINNYVEVMIKIDRLSQSSKSSGHITTAKHLQAAMEYAARDGRYSSKDEKNEISLFDEDGNKLNLDDIKSLAKEWDIGDGSRIARKLIISMPTHEEDEAFNKALQTWLKSNLYNKGYEYVYAVHNDTANIHAHVIVNNRSIDRVIEKNGELINTEANKAFSPKKADLAHMREHFAQYFNHYSKTIKATATKRQVRGKDFTTGTFINNEGKEQIRGKDISQYYAQSNKRNLLVAKRRAMQILNERGINLNSAYHEEKHHQYKNKTTSQVEKYLDQKTINSRAFVINGFNEIANEYQKRARIELKRKNAFIEKGDLDDAKKCELEAQELFSDSQKIRAFIKTFSKAPDKQQDLYASRLADNTLNRAKEKTKEKTK